MTPLTAFLLLFDVKMGPKIKKNRPKIGPESDEFPDRVSVSIFRRFGVHFGAILGAKMDQKSNKRVFETPSKNERKKSTKKTPKRPRKKIRPPSHEAEHRPFPLWKPP